MHRDNLFPVVPGDASSLAAIEALVKAEVAAGEELAHAAALRKGLAVLSSTSALFTGESDSAVSVRPGLGVLSAFSRAGPSLRALLLEAAMLGPTCKLVCDDRCFKQGSATPFVALQTLCALLDGGEVCVQDAAERNGPLEEHRAVLGHVGRELPASLVVVACRPL
mmetsp:Transcript_7306/g.19018  ORF Transcript_7306/g.19018 Transcript_7306/m.19018 type:complete len:166 (+) Transcript_7306:211-708(+)